MNKFLLYLKRYWVSILFCFILLFVQAICDLSLPNFMSNIVNDGILKGQTGHIIRKGVDMLFVTIISATANILVSFMASRVSAGMAKSLRRDIFEKVESFSSNEFDRYSTSSLITRTTNDITQIQMFTMMGIRLLCYAPIMGLGGIVMALSKSVSMSWTIGLSVVILMTLVVSIFIVAMPKFKLVQRLIDKLNLVARENLNGIMVVRAFSTQRFEEKRFDKTNQELTNTNLFINRVMTFMMPLMMFIMNVTSLLIVWVGGYKIEAGVMQVGDMMAFMQYATQIIISFLFVAMMFIMVPRAAVSAQRIFEVLETDPLINDPDQESTVVDVSKCEVSFKNVSFKYNNAEENVIENINFTAPSGKTTAFIGSTGSGKSTLINLIPRFYDVTSGSIEINGINIRNMSQSKLRNMIGYVPQKGILFSGTIASNLRYGDESADNVKIKKAIEVAQSLDFVGDKQNGIDSSIAQGGANVSGGQKQRLSIARALVKKPPIYIFDDSFSALDFKTDVNLRTALKKYTGDSTVLIVAQRISTIMDADQIIVLDEGKIVGKGTHMQLLNECQTYREIAESQFSKEELK